jgi:tRNA A-37 threonylcarbamoyl transferase component Bud32/Flp pilus assembly protein TadD
MDVTGAQDFRRFGPYVLLRCSGAGGFGRVDLALKGSPEMAKVCVVKRMQTDDRSPELSARFRREAEIALGLAHGAIAQTVGVEEIDGELCLLQEFVDGVNLRHLEAQCKPELVPLPVALHIVREVGRALGYAHGLGIVHRDVTPENIMLSFAGAVKLIDFGIARRTQDPTLTQTGVVVGRQKYVAPEIWAGGKADPRSDVFSLGVVLWQLLTGVDFQAGQEKDVSAVPDPLSWNPMLPPALGPVVQKAVAGEPEVRHQSVLKLLEVLDNFIPTDFVGESALTAFLARHFDIARERKMLEEDVASARKLLASPPAVEPGRQVRHHRLWAATALGTGVALAVLGGALWALAQRTHAGYRATSPTPAPSMTAEAEAQSRIALMEMPSHPTSGQAAVAQERAASRAVPEESRAVHPAKRAEVTRRLRDAQTSTRSATDSPQAAGDAGELLSRARSRWDEGDIAGALALGRQATVAGGGADAHTFVGMVLLRDGRTREAAQEFREALRLDPRHRKAAEMLERIRGDGIIAK